MSDKKEEEAKRELTNIRPDKVSLVDRAANGQQFFVIKSADGNNENKLEDIYKDLALGIIKNYESMIVQISDVEGNDDGLVVIDKRFINNTQVFIETLEKIKNDEVEDNEYCFDVNDDKFIAATSMVVGNIKKNLDNELNSDNVVDNIDNTIKLLKNLSNIYIESAKWTRAYINDLPDSAFLYIKSGGEKDDEGKTKPRDLRMFPYKNHKGEVDLPHLRNALARIPQADISDSLKESLSSKARGILDKHTEKNDEESMAEKSNNEENVNVEVSDEKIEKALESAVDKLNSVRAMLAIPEDEQEDYNISYLISDAIWMLIKQAKLEKILGQKVEKDNDEMNNEENNETNENVEKSTGTEEESTEEENNETGTEEESTEEENNETEENVDQNITKNEDSSEDLKNLINQCLGGVKESLDKINEKLSNQDERIEKIENARVPSRSKNTETTVEKSSDDNIFDDFAPLAPIVKK